MRVAAYLALCLTAFAASRATLERNDVWQTSMGLALDIVGKAPEKPRVHNNLGTVFADDVGDPKAAAAEYRLALTGDPDNATILTNLGKQLFLLGNWDEAERRLIEALEKDPDNGQAAYRLAVLRIAQDRSEEALRLLGRAEATIAGHPGIYLARAGIYETAKDWEAAEAAYRASLQWNGTHPPTQLALGKLLFRTGRMEASLEVYRGILAKDPYAAEAYAGVGWALAKMGLHGRAILSLKQCLRLDPGRYAEWGSLARSLQALGDPAQAAVVYERALEIEPSHRQFRLNLGILYWKTLLDGDAACRHFEVLLELGGLAPSMEKRIRDAVAALKAEEKEE